jgi:SH3-like domain-containing protein
MVRWKIPLGIGVILLMVSTTWSGLGVMSVQVRNGQLRATPSFLGAVVGSVNYGDQVDVQQEQGDWMQINGKGQTGWIHSSALTTKYINIGGGGKDAQMKASGKEVALAGKGFNAEVEAQYRKGRQNVNYLAVDQMELITISPQEMVAFVDKGELKPSTGGVK